MKWIMKSEMFTPPQKLELPKKHHSLADWDFLAGLIYALDNAVYVSSPSSLRITVPSASGLRVGCLNKDSSCVNLPQGRIETQLRSTSIGNARPAIIFRNQGGVGSIDNDNTYFVTVAGTTANATKRVAGGITGLGSWSRSYADNTWYQERITWWNEPPALILRYEYWDGSAWVIVTPDITDSAPSFEGSTTNRCGLGDNRTGGPYYNYFDDTMIYGPA